jgi:hypothetical protein
MTLTNEELSDRISDALGYAGPENPHQSITLTTGEAAGILTRLGYADQWRDAYLALKKHWEGAERERAAAEARAERYHEALSHYADRANWVTPLSFSEHSTWHYYRWGGNHDSSVYREPWAIADAALSDAPASPSRAETVRRKTIEECARVAGVYVWVPGIEAWAVAEQIEKAIRTLADAPKEVTG